MSILHNLGGKSLKDFTNQAGIYCIYGMPGSGKTTLFGGGNIRPIMLSVDQTTDGGLVAAAHNAGGMGFNLNTIDRVIEVTKGLLEAAEKGEITPETHDWIVLDHLGGLYTLCMNSCTAADREAFKKSKNMTQYRQNIGAMSVYPPVNALFKSLLGDIMALKEKGFKIAIIAHQKNLGDKALLAKGLSNSTPAVSINVSDTLTSWLSAKLTALIHTTKESKVTVIANLPGQPRQEPKVENRYFIRLKTDNLQDIKVRTTLGTEYPSKIESPMNAPYTMNDVLAVIKGEQVVKGVQDDVLTQEDAKALAATIEEDVPVVATPAATVLSVPAAPVINIPTPAAAPAAPQPAPAPVVAAPTPVTPAPVITNAAAPVIASLDAINDLLMTKQGGN